MGLGQLQKTLAEKKGIWQPVLAALAAFFSLLSLTIDFTQDRVLSSFDGYDAVYVALFVPLFLLFRRVSQLQDRRTRRYSLVAALLLAADSLLGRAIMASQTLAVLGQSAAAIFQNLWYFVGRFALYYGVVAITFDVLVRRSAAWSIPRPVKPGRTPFFQLWGSLMLCWIGYLIIFYPGLLSEDSMNQVAQVLGESPLKNDNPLAHTLLIGLFVHIGLFFGNINWGVVVYSFFQMTAMSGIFALCIDHLREKGLPRRLWVPALVVWAFLPVYPIFAITMWKDILLGGSVVLLGLQIILILEHREDYFAKRWRIFALLGTGLLMSLIKSNGILIFLPTMLLLLPFLPKLRKWLALCAAAITGLYLLVQGPLYGALGAESGSVREILSLPTQQMSRIVLLHEDELDPADVETFYAFFPMDGHAALEENYNWAIVDGVKSQFDEQTFSDDGGAFFRLWGRLVRQYPGDAFDQILNNTLGYWYPEMQQWMYILNTRANDFGILDSDTGGILWLRNWVHKQGLPAIRQIPMVAMLTSIGFSFVLLLLTALLAMRKRRYHALLAFLPSLFMWVNALLSPVNCEYRYAFGMIASLPLLIPWVCSLAERKA